MGERRLKGIPMKRSVKRPVLSPEHAAWLASTIERNRKFAGMRMMADDPAPSDDPKPDDPPKGDPKPDDPDKLGEGGKKALEAERTRAKAAEEAAKATKTEFDTLKAALLEGLGITGDDPDKGDDVLKTVQEQLAAIQRESAVLKLANTHKITDDGDLKILASATDAEQMKALAERLAPKEQDSDATSRRGPKPDRTQGGGSGGETPNRGGSVAAVMEERAAARAAKKTNSNV